MTKTSLKLGRTTDSTIGVTKEDIQNLIAKKAYELFEKRGRKQGHAAEDWLEAERIIKSKLSMR